jgi:hypothetical protein
VDESSLRSQPRKANKIKYCAVGLLACYLSHARSVVCVSRGRTGRFPQLAVLLKPADYSGRADDDEALRTSGWDGHHDNGRSSIQSTYNRRSQKSQTPSIFTNVSW